PPLAPNEPPYCLLSGLRSREIAIDTNGLERAHAYRLGSVTVVGVGVGNSQGDALQSLATHTATSLAPEQRSCTFYYNDGNDDASHAFVWRNLPKPTGVDYASMTALYAQEIGDLFDTNTPSFVSCASDSRYLAMGCDGMKHRG